MSDCQAMLLGIGFGNNLNFGNVSELFWFSNGLPWVAKGGFRRGFRRVSMGFPGGFLPDFTLGLFTMNYAFAGICSSKSDKTGVSKRIRVSLL